MRLQQNQVWKKGTLYIRAVKIERLAVNFKIMNDLTSGDGEHQRMTKKNFCRLIKDAELVEKG